LTAASDERAERKPRRVEETRAVVTDDATGASIEAWLLPTVAWQRMLCTTLKITKALETDHELFLVAQRP
jgi:hypothetical protein